MKRLPALLCSAVLALGLTAGLPALSASAANTASQDGLKVTLKTDKSSYKSDEDVELSIVAENTNNCVIGDVSVEMDVPEELELISGSLSEKFDEIGPNESVEISAVLGSKNKPEETKDTAASNVKETTSTTTEAPASNKKEDTKKDSPQTGDDFNTAALVIAIALIGVIAVFTAKNPKKASKIFSVFLCVMIFASSTPLVARSVDDGYAVISVDTAAKFDGTEFKFSGSVSYEIPDAADLREVKINTDELVLSEDGTYYLAAGSFSKLSGTLANFRMAEKFSYRILNDKNIVVLAGDIEPAKEWTAASLGLFVGLNKVAVSVEYRDGTKASDEVMIYNTYALNMENLDLDKADDDNDGLPNYLEEYFNTDKNSADTDGDGVSDFDEINVLGTDPSKKDTDGNGINDGDEDFDGDTLSNIEELKLGTDPSNKDTDGDMLDDNDEVNKYGTDPLKWDTDGDEVCDSLEIEYGYDPNTAEETFTITKNAEENDDTVKPSVNIDLSGSQVQSLSVAPVANKNLFPADKVYGYIGQAYEFHVDGTFNRAAISFEFDEALLEDPDFEPVIYHYDEEKQLLVEVETTVDGNVATANVTHFSKYILLNKTEFDKVWELEIKPMSNKTTVALPMDLALVIDGSGTMTSNDRQNLRYEAARNIIAKTGTSDQVAVIGFDNYAKLCTGFTSDKAASSAAVTKTFTDGGTSIYNGIILAQNQFDALKRNSVKVMIVLTDGLDNYRYDYSSIIAKAKASGITIYTIGLGNASNIDVSLLTNIATSTGGKYYHATTAGDLVGMFESAEEDIDLSKDSDEDGLCDAHEKGRIRLGRGYYISTNPHKKDTDRDNVIDGDEIYPVMNPDGKSVAYFMVNSDPTLKDTDDDGYQDDVDLAPTEAFINPVMLIHGRGDSTYGAFGVESEACATVTIDGDKHTANYHYDAEYPINSSHLYTSIEAQKITGVYDMHKIGWNLQYRDGVDGVNYTPNKNLFAFNYPDQDFNVNNAAKLQLYIKNLKNAALNGTYGLKESDIFATKDDKNNKRARFIFVVHSNGGLCSRFYIENLGGDRNVDKLITIDTPHYGSGLAYASGFIDLADWVSDCYPLDVELQPNSTLFGGMKQEFVSVVDLDRAIYINYNQSPALKGQDGIRTKYYAIGGYDVNLGERLKWPEKYENTRYGFEFFLASSSKVVFEQSILGAVQRNISKDVSLSLNSSDGDNVVNIWSQFGAEYNSDGSLKRRITFERTGLVIDTINGHTPKNHFHGQTLSCDYTVDLVKTFIAAS